MSARVSVTATIGTACRLVLDRRGELFRVGLVFILGMFAIGVFAFRYIFPLLWVQVPQVGGPVAGRPMPDPRLLPGMLLMLVAEFILVAVFAVGWHRLILLGPRAGGGLGVGLGRRELAYFGRMWLCLLGFFLFTLAFVMVGSAVVATMPDVVALLAGFAYFLAVIYVLGRLGPAFAALSVDQRLGFDGAWRATAGEGTRILAIYLLANLGWSVVTVVFSTLAHALGLGLLAPYAFLFVNSVLSAAMVAVLVTINAVLFRQLAGWRPPGST